MAVILGMNRRSRWGTTPLLWEEWDMALQQHPDQCFRNYIVQGIRDDFRLGYQYGFQCKLASKNLRSALQCPLVVGDYLETECGAGRVVGPLKDGEWKTIMTDHFGVIPKGKTGEMEANSGPIITGGPQCQ